MRLLARTIAGTLAVAVLSALMLFRPEDVPPAYAPWQALDPAKAPNIATRLKLMRAGRDLGYCHAALEVARARAAAIPDVVTSDQCHMRGSVRLEGLWQASMAPEATRCEMALRLYMWERHALQPAAIALLGAPVARIDHYGSYSCREIRSHRGPTGRMSEHATANAFDISGFVLAGGRQITLRRDWNGAATEAAFLRAARDGLCRYFRVVLGPDYNALHADHFHVDQGLFLSCR